jgi:hypothetical protein
MRVRAARAFSVPATLTTASKVVWERFTVLCLIARNPARQNGMRYLPWTPV